MFFATVDDPNVQRSDGIIGLRPASKPNDPIQSATQKSYLQQLMSNNIIDDYIFGISIQQTNSA